MKLSLRKGVEYPVSMKLLVVALVVNILVAIFVFVVRNNLPPEVPLFYNKPEGEEQLVSPTTLFLPSLLSFLVLGVNSLVVTLAKDEFIQKLLIYSVLGITALSAIATIKVILLVASF